MRTDTVVPQDISLSGKNKTYSTPPVMEERRENGNSKAYLLTFLKKNTGKINQDRMKMFIPGE